MALSDYPVSVSVAVSDGARASAFYEGKLGLEPVSRGADGSRIYSSGGRAALHVYPSPATAGQTTATVATWYVDDIEALIDEMVAAGVSFARYDGIAADDRGIAARAGGGKVAWFTDPDGNTFALEAD